MLISTTPRRTHNLRRWRPLLMHRPAKTFFVLCGIILGLAPLASSARLIEHDPLGFYGIAWGEPLADRSEFVRLESEPPIDIYTLKTAEPKLGEARVESIKFLAHDNRFVQVMIRYRGTQTHQSILHYLEEHYGPIHLERGAMMRGLNQQYSWRGPETEISVNYRGLVERGFLTAQSRVLAPRFLDFLSDNAF